MITPSFGLTATERVLPKLALDFTTASLDSRITFARTTGASNPATYVNSIGVVTVATNNQPRFDYDPVTLVCKGLLIEESRTNICKYSGDLSVSGAGNWNVTAAGTGVTPVVTGNYAVAPDGTTTATRIQFSLGGGTTSSDQSLQTQVITQTSAWGSFYLKTTDGSTKTVYLRGAAATSVTIDGIWRRYDFNAGNMSGSQFAVGLRGGQSPTNSNTADLLVWGAQLEAGAFATSYIPTTSAALTRNADVATMTGTNFSSWFNASEGTFEILVNPNNNTAVNSTDGVARGQFCVSDGTSANRLRYQYFGEAGVNSGGVTVATLTFSGATSPLSNPTVDRNITVSYKVNAFATARDGVAGPTDSAGAVPVSPNNIIFGYATQGYNGNMNGYVKKFSFYPQKLTANELTAFSKG